MILEFTDCKLAFCMQNHDKYIDTLVGTHKNHSLSKILSSSQLLAAVGRRVKDSENFRAHSERS
jgi:hypothetical protein